MVNIRRQPSIQEKKGTKGEGHTRPKAINIVLALARLSKSINGKKFLKLKNPTTSEYEYLFAASKDAITLF